MKLIGMMPVRNESWVLGLSARVALKWCDQLVIMWHCAEHDPEKEERALDAITDELVSEFTAERVRVILNIDNDWNEMGHRQAMLTAARQHGATHLAIVDADEVMTANLIPGVRRCSEMLSPGQGMMLPGYNLRHSINQYHATGIWGNRWFSAVFADSPELHWAGARFHHREPMGLSLAWQHPVPHGRGGIMHLWGANEKRLVAKHRLYKVTERILFPDKPVADIEYEYNQATRGRPNHGDTPATWKFLGVPAEWWNGHADLMRHLHLDAEPWQDAEADRLIALHGRAAFAGLSV